jgi:hypothetical protein
MALLFCGRGIAFPLGIAIARSYTRKAFLGCPARVFPQILHSPRENAHSNCYQPQDVVFIWLVSAERREVDRNVSYLGFGSISGIVHLIASLPSVTRAVMIVAAVVVLCR